MLKIRLDAIETEMNIRGLQDRVSDLTPALRDFHAYMIRRTVLMFRRLRKGGSFRGVSWQPFANQYTRVTDGVTVPAWGGVPRLRAGRSARKVRSGFVRGAYSDLQSRKLRGQKATGGTVRGRVRHSGKRVTKGASVMADSGRLRNAALTRQQIRIDSRRALLRMDTPLPYAAVLHSRRPFQFFEDPVDINVARRIIVKHLVGK